MRFSALSGSLLLALLAFVSSPSHAAIASFSGANIVLGSGQEFSTSLLAAGVLDPDEAFTVSGFFTITPTVNTSAGFDPVFLVGNGTTFFGGELEGTNGTNIIASANGGSTANDASFNENNFINVASTSPFEVSFVVEGGAGTTSTVSFGGSSGSFNSLAAPNFIGPINAENGLVLLLANVGGSSLTFTDVQVTVVPEPATALAMLSLASLAVLRRRRRA